MSMTRITSCINVYSVTNQWIDFIIVPVDYSDFGEAEDIINQAYDDWWDSEEADSDIPIAEYIGMKLTENDIEFEIYFKEKDEEEDE